jgi:uncharacterized integral membrane protein
MMSNDDRDLSRERTSQSAASGGNGISPSLIGFAVVVILAVVFFFWGGKRVEVNFWLFDWNTTVRWSLLMSMFLGVLLDRLFGIWWRHRAKKKDEAKRARG